MTYPDLYQENALNALGAEIVEINKANGWNVLTPDVWPEGEVLATKPAIRIAAVLALVHSEASEALEAIRHNDRDNFAEELADILMRVLDAGVGLGLDMDGAVRTKLEKNKNRGHKHGNKLI